MFSVVPFIVALVMIVVVGGILAIVWFTYQRSQREQRQQLDAYQRWAAEHGLQYAPVDFTALTISTQPPLGAALGRNPVNVFRGVHRGAHMLCFELRYTVYGGDESRTYHFQVTAIGLPAARPLLDVGQENFMSQRFGEDIDFENQAFNDRFKIQSPNPRFAHDVITAGTMEWMLADPRASYYQWRFEGPWLMSLRPGHFDLNEVFPGADFLHEVLGRVPKHVWGS